MKGGAAEGLGFGRFDTISCRDWTRPANRSLSTRGQCPRIDGTRRLVSFSVWEDACK